VGHEPGAIHPPHATVTGRAFACQGVVNGHPKVTVQALWPDGRLVQSETLESGGTYKLLLTPGHYLIRALPYKPVRVSLRAGEIWRHTFFNICV